MTEKIARSRLFSRVSEMIVPVLSWLIITFPLWMSPFHPAVVAYFIISFDLYFFYKSIKTIYLAVVSYKKTIAHMRISYVKKLRRLPDARQINHFVIIPNYKEPLYKLEATIDSFTSNDYPYKNIFLVLAFEEREEAVAGKARKLQEKYRRFFREIFVCLHQLSEFEAAGKASNQTFAAQLVDKYVQKEKIKRESVLITICDADSHLPTNYFSYLSYEYLKDKDRLYHFYWAPVLLYNNFWQLPLFVRMQATLSSILRLAFLSYKENLIQVSTYSTNLWLLKKINFWDVDIIPEDWHVYLQAFFTFGEKVRTLPLFTIINGDAVYSGTLIKTLVNRYEQEKRWAWGVSDMGYALKKSLTSPQINPITKIRKIIFLAEHHIFWPTSFFILTLSASIPPLVNPVFKRTVLGFLLPRMSGIILSITSLMLILYVYLDIKLRKKVNMKTTTLALPILFIQWYLLPVVSFLLSSLPALEAHTRIILGKRIQYKVTEKV